MKQAMNKKKVKKESQEIAAADALQSCNTCIDITPMGYISILETFHISSCHSQIVY